MLKVSRGTIPLILFIFSTQLAVLTDRTLAGVEDVLYKEGGLPWATTFCRVIVTLSTHSRH